MVCQTHTHTHTHTHTRTSKDVHAETIVILLPQEVSETVQLVAEFLVGFGCPFGVVVLDFAVAVLTEVMHEAGLERVHGRSCPDDAEGLAALEVDRTVVAEVLELVTGFITASNTKRHELLVFGRQWAADRHVLACQLVHKGKLHST
jgi:primosomal replication protein N